MRPSHLATQYKHQLSPRQRDVMEMLVRGLTNAEIAERLGVSLDGAKYHVREILGKLGAESREEAVAIWRETPTRPAPWARLGGMVAAKFAAASVAVTVIAITIVSLVVMLARDDDNEPPAAQETTNAVPKATSTAVPTPAPALTECTSLDVTLALETVPRGDAVLVRVSASGSTPCKMLGPFVLWLIRPPVDPGPEYPPEANTSRDIKIALEFPFNGVLGEWRWENWCAEPMNWVFWQAKAPGGSGPQVGLSNDFWPPCTNPDRPSTLAQERVYAGLDGDSTPDRACVNANFVSWLCEFATRIAIDGVAGRNGLAQNWFSNSVFFLCDGEGSAPGLGDSDICMGKDDTQSVRGYWLQHSGRTGYVSQPDFEAAIGPALPQSAALGSIGCATGDECSRFVVGLGAPGAISVALIFRLEGGREPAVIGAVIDVSDRVESPFGAFDLRALGPRE